MRSSTDVVVIGGGVIGCATAYYLSLRGYRVTLFEKHEIAGGASGCNMGNIAVHTMRRELIPMGIFGARAYQSLSRELDSDIEYERSGAIIMIETEKELEYMRHQVADLRNSGVSIELLTREDCLRLEPAVNPSIIAATYWGDHVHVNPQRLTYAFANAARNLGATILSHASVLRIEVIGGRVSGVATEQGHVNTSWVINAAGAWSATVGKLARIEHAIGPRRGQIMVTERRPGLIHTKLSCISTAIARHQTQSGQGSQLGLGLNINPTKAGNLLLGSTNEAVGFDISNSVEGGKGMADYISRMVSMLRGVRILRSFASLRPVTPDGMPLIGRSDGPEGYLIATGHGGQGIGLAPATACYLAELVSSNGKGSIDPCIGK